MVPSTVPPALSSSPSLPSLPLSSPRSLPHLARDSGRAEHYNSVRTSLPLAAKPFFPSIAALRLPPSPSTSPIPLVRSSTSSTLAPCACPPPLSPFLSSRSLSYHRRCITTRCRDTRLRFSRVKPSLIPRPRSIRYERHGEASPLLRLSLLFSTWSPLTSRGALLDRERRHEEA